MGTLRIGNSYEDRFGFHAKGSFNCKYKSEPFLLAVVIAATAAMWWVAFLRIVSPQMSPMIYAMALALISAVFFLIGVGAVRVVLAGGKFFYEADDKEFRIYKERGGNKILAETFYFIDVTEVSFQKMKPFRGFLVTVSTKYREYKYRYLFRGGKSTRNAEHCPFYILEQRKGEGNTDK